MSPSVQKLLTPGNGRPEFPREAYSVRCFSRCIIYVAPIAQIFNSHGIKFHQYADDTQLYTTVKSEDVANLQALVDCVRVVTDWFLINDLQLIADKTEAIRFGTRQQLAKHRENSVLHLTGCDIKYDTSVKILGVQLDSTLSMSPHADSVVKSCNFHIRALRHIRKSVLLEAAKTIAHGLVASRLDYCNSLLFNTSRSNIQSCNTFRTNSPE